MKNGVTQKSKKKGIKAFRTIYVIGIIFAILKLIEYLNWTSQLVRNWNLPDEPFFSKVNLMNSNIDLSISTYLIFSIAYIIVFGFVLLGFYQLNSTTKLLTEKKIFKRDISISLKKAGNSFLIFAFGTLAIDTALLFVARTSNRIIDLLSTELIIFLIFGYLLFFLSDVFREGVTINEENELII